MSETLGKAWAQLDETQRADIRECFAPKKGITEEGLQAQWDSAPEGLRVAALAILKPVVLFKKLTRETPAGP